MQNLILFIAMAVAAGCGYFVGGWSGRDAKEALTRIEASAKQSDAEYKKTTQALTDKLASLDSEHQKEKQKIEDDFKQQKTSFDTAVASRDTRIADLVKTRAGIQADIAKAQAQLAAAKTDKEKQVAQAALDAANKKETVAVASLDSAQCESAKVSPSLLAALKGGAP
jgi:hypothetical protein